MSGYFRDPEPWEIAGGGDDYEEDCGSRSSKAHTLNTLPATPEVHEEEEDEEEYPFPSAFHQRSTSQLGEIQSGVSGAGVRLLDSSRRVSEPDTPDSDRYPPTPTPLLANDRSRTTSHPRLGYESQPQTQRPRRTTNTSSASDSRMEEAELFAFPPFHGRSTSDDRYPTLGPLAHRKDSSASSLSTLSIPSIPSQPYIAAAPPNHSQNHGNAASTNPLKALVDRLRPHHQKAEQETGVLDPIPSARSSTFALSSDNLPAGGSGARSGTRTPTNVMAGVGSGGSSRMMGLSVSLPVDQNLVDFNAGLKKQQQQLSEESGPFTYPSNELVESPQEFGVIQRTESRESDNGGRRSGSGSGSGRPRPRGPRNSLSSGTFRRSDSGS